MLRNFLAIFVRLTRNFRIIYSRCRSQALRWRQEVFGTSRSTSSFSRPSNSGQSYSHNRNVMGNLRHP